MSVITDLFLSWDLLPDLSHLRDSEIAHIKHSQGDVTYVAYILTEGIVTAFGSCSYYDEYEKQLWIESLVSTKPGQANLVLQELERILCYDLAKTFWIRDLSIHVMTTPFNLNFYEKNGYSVMKPPHEYNKYETFKLTKPRCY
jgi:hypothetical protein